VESIKHSISPKKRAVQFIFSGKAHPKDIPGKDLIRQIVHFTRTEGIEQSVVFVPNYDIFVNRLMVAGCDIWLNNPRRPREASGTSGMKAAMNGLPNLSVLDGWWDEADYTRTGWAIGHGEEYDDPDYQDDIEANALYELLEQSVVPLFYDRDDEDLPRGWIAKMKDAIRFNCPHFNTARMVGEYATRAYFPASDRYRIMTTDNYAPAKDLATWKARLFEHWYDMKILDIAVSAVADIQVNQSFSVKARVDLAALTPEDVQVELYKGQVDANGEIVHGIPVVMDYQGKDSQNCAVYTINISYSSSGLQGLSLRVVPKHDYLSNPLEMGLVLWAQG
jgi:starch phosphorylase